MTKREINEIAYRIIGCAIEVHKHLGPGLLESIYQECLIEELISNGLKVESEKWVPVIYKGKLLKGKLKLDLLVEDHVIVELKAVETLVNIHQAQLLSHMNLIEKPKGILINFNTGNIVQQAIHLVNKHFAQLPD